MAFLYKRLLRIFGDNGRDHVGRGVDRDISLGGCVLSENRNKGKEMNRNLEKRQNEESVSSRDFNK